MKSYKNVRSKVLIIISTIFIIVGCNEFKEPDLINNPNQEYTSSPEITSITPAGEAIAGVREIEINGNNFAVDGSDTNWVFLGGEPADVKSITENKIVVHRPATFGDDISISVVVPSALNIAQELSYKIEEPVVEYGDFTRENYDLMAIAVDADENLFVATRRKILTLASNGVDLVEFVSLGSTFAKFTDLKFGPGGYLYAALSKKDIYKIDPVTGTYEKFAKVNRNTEKLDFDTNGNLFTGRRDGLAIINPSGTVTQTTLYDDISLKELRVYDQYLYVATSDQLSRNKILDNNGTLGETEIVLDLLSTSEYSNCEIKSFNIRDNGEFYLCLANHPTYNLFVLESNSSLTPFYKNANIIPRTVDQIIWGTGNNVYLNRGITLPRDSVRLYRMGMESNGAPYNGRNL